MEKTERGAKERLRDLKFVAIPQAISQAVREETITAEQGERIIVLINEK